MGKIGTVLSPLTIVMSFKIKSTLHYKKKKQF